MRGGGSRTSNDVVGKNQGEVLRLVEKSIAEESSVNNDFNVSLVDVPTDGYGYKDKVKVNIHINNATTERLDKLIIQFKVKKKLIDDYSSNLHGVEFNSLVDFGGTIVSDYSADLVRGLQGIYTIDKNDPYETDSVFMNPVSVGKRVDMLALLNIDRLTLRTKGLLIPSKDYLSNRDFEIEYKISNGTQILGTGILPIHVKGPDLITSQRQFGLDLTRVGRSGEYNAIYFNTYTYNGTRTGVFDVVDDKDKKFWLVVRDKKGEEGLYQYVEDSKFKFKIPQGFKLDEDSLRLYYSGMDYKVDGNIVEVNVRPGDVGLSIGYDGDYVRRGLQVYSSINNYFALPLIKTDEQFDTYSFSVDTSSGSFPSVSDLTLNNKKTFNIKSELDLIEAIPWYTNSLGINEHYIYDDDSLRFPSGYTYNVSSLEYDTKIDGATMRAMVFSPSFFQNVKLYGIREDGSRVVLDSERVKAYSYILGEYFKTKPLITDEKSVVHIPNDILKLRFEFTKTIKGGAFTHNIPIWDITDVGALSRSGGVLRLGVNGVIKDYPYSFHIYDGRIYQYRWGLYNTVFRNNLNTYLLLDGGDTPEGRTLFEKDTSRLRKHVILKTPKDFKFSFTGDYSSSGSFYDVVGEEVYGDTKYTLISQKKTSQVNTPSLIGSWVMLPTVQDGIYSMSSRVYLEGRDTLPSWLTIKPYETKGQEYSFQFDPSRSIRDNYELVTDGTEAHAKITVEKPKILSTTTLVNDTTSLKVKTFDEVFNIKSYIVNDASDPVVHPVLDVVVPEKLELQDEVAVPSGYKVQYQLDGSTDYIDNVTDYSVVRKYRVVAVDSTASILPNTSLEVTAPMKLKRGITSNVNEVLKTTVTHNGGTLISAIVNVTSDLQEFKDGIVNVKWVDENGTTLKTQKLTGQHGSKYVVDRAMFTKDSKYYKYVSTEGIPDGTYVGGVTSEVVVHMKEQDISFELPMTGTYGTIGVLSALLGILGITFVRKRGR